MLPEPHFEPHGDKTAIKKSPWNCAESGRICLAPSRRLWFLPDRYLWPPLLTRRRPAEPHHLKAAPKTRQPQSSKWPPLAPSTTFPNPPPPPPSPKPVIESYFISSSLVDSTILDERRLEIEVDRAFVTDARPSRLHSPNLDLHGTSDRRRQRPPKSHPISTTTIARTPRNEPASSNVIAQCPIDGGASDCGANRRASSRIRYIKGRPHALLHPPRIPLSHHSSIPHPIKADPPRLNSRMGSNPRRRPNTKVVLAGLNTSDLAPIDVPGLNLSLPKGATFHGPTSPPSDEDDPLLDVHRLPRRSPTCLETLEGLIVADRTHQVAQWIGTLPEPLINPDASSSSSSSRALDGRRPDEHLPLPQGLLEGIVPAGAHADSTLHPDATSSSNGRSRRIRRLRRTRRASVHQQGYDSGIGESIGGTAQHLSDDGNHRLIAVTFWTPPLMIIAVAETDESGVDVPIIRHHPLVTRTLTGHLELSHHAAQLIKEHVLEPLRRRATLSDFHPLVESIPSRIDAKELRCLRDVEKTLLWSAPVSDDGCPRLPLLEQAVAHGMCWFLQACAKSPESYLRFCETSIQCIHTTVNHIGEHERQRPSDRPYTNGYVVDLVGQIREYARMMAASRQRQQPQREQRQMQTRSAEKVKVQKHEEEENDYSSSVLTNVIHPVHHSPSDRSDEVQLEGGLTHNGQPARLVRVKKGKVIPIVARPTEDGMEAHGDDGAVAPPHMKRSLSEGSVEEDSVLRSMARRRKLAPGEMVSEPVLHGCSGCNKTYKRACDLTYMSPASGCCDSCRLTIRRKHEKTHSRPWKCSEPSCKYHSYGWPTEKERDRHYNDKHSANPTMHHCRFPNCSYKTKRESNCKQHMEKSHNWEYKRAKGNGRKGKKETTAAAAAAAAAATPRTMVEDVNTPTSSTMDGSSRTLRTPSVDVGSLPPLSSPEEFNFNGLSVEHLEGLLDQSTAQGTFDPPGSAVDAYSPFRASMADQNFAMTMPPPASTAPAPAFTDPFTGLTTNDMTNPFGLNDHLTWDALNSFNVGDPTQQLPTPDRSVERRPFGSFSHGRDVDVPRSAVSYTSPMAARISHLSPTERAHPTLYSPASAQNVLDDEGFQDDFTPHHHHNHNPSLSAPPPPPALAPTQPGHSMMDFTLYNSREPTLPVNGSMFPDLPNYNMDGYPPTGLGDDAPFPGSAPEPPNFLAEFMETDS